MGREVFIAAALFVQVALGWFVMISIHESGHIAAALLTGGRIVDCQFWPWCLPYTLVSPNPRPLVVGWAGPIAGTAVPTIVWFVFARDRRYGILAFLAAFSLVANALYIGVASFTRVADAKTLLSAGSHISWLWVFSIAAMIVGYTWLRRCALALVKLMCGEEQQASQYLLSQVRILIVWIGVQSLVAYQIATALSG